MAELVRLHEYAYIALARRLAKPQLTVYIVNVFKPPQVSITPKPQYFT